MKIKPNKNQDRFSIVNLTAIELDVLLAVAYTVDKRCFNMQEDSGIWFSNDDFILTMTDEQRKALADIGKIINTLYNSPNK